MTLYHGRPDDMTGRPDKEVRVYDLLDRLGVAYTCTDHAPAATMEDCLDADRLLGVTMCKNLFLCNRQKTKFYLLMMPGGKPFKTKDISAQIASARLSFADGDAMEAYLDITPGAVSVMGLMNDAENHVQLLIDKPVLEEKFLGCHPCVNTSSLCMTTEDLLKKFLPAVNHAPVVVDLPAYE